MITASERPPLFHEHILSLSALSRLSSTIGLTRKRKGRYFWYFWIEKKARDVVRAREEERGSLIRNIHFIYNGEYVNVTFLKSIFAYLWNIIQIIPPKTFCQIQKRIILHEKILFQHYPTFIHNKGKANYGPFIVEVLNYHQYPAMTSHMVKVMKRVDPPTRGNKGPPKVPTLEGHPAYQVNRPMVMPGQSFRFKPMYRGRFRELSHVPMDASIMSEDGTGGTSGNRFLVPGSSLPRTQSCGIVFDDGRFNEVQQYQPEHSIHNHPQPNSPPSSSKTFSCVDLAGP
ncbi:hypothetical protein WR25_05995 isoform B [Diploscapter pachys]|uniref:Uncharacterized protein n=1 Tax=Diploscapter pachys TaxID=2018661 RepID=A0A2A2LQB1_9BILA|nr:hypothetical protein WR25_05995 isoform A [Diploscapter pachys]PAV88414.1 hypothetical protein WR25_05995 isoform B [Diploscapter pachys]